MSDVTLEDLLKRVERLEKLVFSQPDDSKKTSSGKAISLPEIARRTVIKNGQHKITAIVGFNELILKQDPVSMSEIKNLWQKGKFVGKSDPKLLERAIIDGFVRELDNKVYDLTQKGEDFFQELLHDNEQPSKTK